MALLCSFLWLSNIPLDRGWDGWMASLTRWTWVWVNSWSWWWTGRPGVLRFMGLQRVGHDWVTELNWTEYSVVSMYHFFFIHSSVSGHLGCFHLPATVNSTAMNNGIHVSFQVWFPQGICLGVGLLGHMVVLFLVFKVISILFSIVAVWIYASINSARAFLFLHTLSSIYCL